MSTALAINRTSSVKSVFSKLDLRDDYKIALEARKGVAVKLFYDLAKSAKISEKQLASMINLSARTISNYNKKKKCLEPVYGEHLLKLITLFEKGEEAFGNIDEFNYWLEKPFWNQKEKPADWLVTPGGVHLVREELDRLAHGYPV